MRITALIVLVAGLSVALGLPATAAPNRLGAPAFFAQALQSNPKDSKYVHSEWKRRELAATYCEPHYCRDDSNCTSNQPNCGTCWAGTCGPAP